MPQCKYADSVMHEKIKLLPNFKSVRTESLRYPVWKQEEIINKWTIQRQKQNFLIPNSLFLHSFDFKGATKQALNQLDF